MNVLKRIKEIIYKVKDYDRLESDYCTLLDHVTNGILSKPNYKMDGVFEVVAQAKKQRDEWLVDDVCEWLKGYYVSMTPKEGIDELISALKEKFKDN